MNMNSSQARVVDPVLSTILQGYRSGDLVGFDLFPAVPVYSSGGQIIEFGKESLKNVDATRAPGGNTKRVQFGYAGKPFNLISKGLEGKVPVEHMRDAERVPGVKLASIAVKGTMWALLSELEREQAQIATNPDNYGVNHKITLTGDDKWTDGSSLISGHIDTGREVVRQATGAYPNTMLLSAMAFNAMKDHPRVVERFKYTSKDSITPEMLASLYEFKKVKVGTAVTFNESGVGVDVWGNNVILAYVPEDPSTMNDPSYGYTYTMDGHPLAEEPYFDKNSQSWFYPVKYERAAVLSGISSGYLIQGPG